MKYKLNDYLHLCGFKNLPYVMLDSRKANYQFLDKDTFEFIYLISAAYLEAFTNKTISTENSPLASYENYLINYEDPNGSGRITLIK